MSKNLVEFRRRSGEIGSNPVFRRGAYVAENTARGACVDLSAVSGQLKARSVARPLCQRSPWTSLTKGLRCASRLGLPPAADTLTRAPREVFSATYAPRWKTGLNSVSPLRRRSYARFLTDWSAPGHLSGGACVYLAAFTVRAEMSISAASARVSAAS